MIQAHAFLDESERTAVEDAIREAEGTTSAEIVVAIATASGRYDRAEDIVGLWLGALALVTTYFVMPFPEELPDWGWSMLHLRCLALVLAVVIGFTAGAVISSYWLALRRLFTPAAQMRQEANLRARQVFYDSRVHHTQSATGLLIYIALYERQTVLLADQAVLRALPSGMLDDLCRTLTQGIREGKRAETICDVVRAVAERLSHELPRAADDVDEISNRVVILD